MRLNTVTTRLTLWFALTFGVLAAIGFTIFNVDLTRRLQHQLDDDLHSDAVELWTIVHASGVGSLQTEFEIESASNGAHRVIYALWSADGKLEAHSGVALWPGARATAEVHAVADPTTSVGYRQRLPGGIIDVGDDEDEAEFQLMAVRDASGRLLLVGESRNEMNEVREQFQATFATWLALVTLAGCILGWLVARRAMQGVTRVTQTARMVGDGDFGQRVPRGGEGAEIEALADSFNAMLSRIESLIRELQQVTHDIAHDLRSPLTRMRGIAELTLRQTDVRPEERELAVVVLEECERLVSLINTSLEIAEANAAVAALVTSPVDLGALLADAVELFEPLAESGGVRLVMEGEGSALGGDNAAEPSPAAPPVMVLADRGRLQRAVANVLDNAIKYTPLGGVVTVSLAPPSAGGEMAVAVFRDTGIGIDAVDLPNVFNRFFRSDRSRTAPGNGLGLSLAHAIISAHGGTIQLDSTLGVGTVVTLQLPRATTPSPTT